VQPVKKKAAKQTNMLFILSSFRNVSCFLVLCQDDAGSGQGIGVYFFSVKIFLTVACFEEKIHHEVL
jgi:hypothetical protein